MSNFNSGGNKGSTIVRELFGDYSAILGGLLVGAMAHFGKLVAEGKMPTVLQAIGYLMQLALVGLVSAVLTKKFGLVDADTRALTTAILALSTNEVVQFLKRRKWRAIRDAFFHQEDTI